MPVIEVSTKIKRPKIEVYKTIKNMESFPTFMRDIKNLNVIKRFSENRIVTSWETEIDGAPVSWKEEDIFDDKNCQVKFSMLEGYYKSYQGYWLLKNEANGTKLSLRVEFDWGIPILEKHVGMALENKARHSLLGMLQAIRKKLERNNV